MGAAWDVMHGVGAKSQEIGFLKGIDYRAEKLAVFCFGYGGLVLFVSGVVLLILV